MSDPVGAGRYGSGSEAVIAPEYDGERRGFERTTDLVVQLLTDMGDFAHVLFGGVCWLLCFRDWGGEVALVHHGASERRDAGGHTRDPKR